MMTTTTTTTSQPSKPTLPNTLCAFHERRRVSCPWCLSTAGLSQSELEVLGPEIEERKRQIREERKR